MDQQTKQLIPKCPKGLWLIVIVVVVAALIAGGSVYAWQKSAARKSTDVLQQQINDLQNQIQQLQQDKDEDTTPADETANWQIYRNEEWAFEIKYPSAQGIKAFPEVTSYPSETIVEFRPKYAWEPPNGHEGGWEPARLEIAHENYKGSSLQDHILKKWNDSLNFAAYNSGRPLTVDLLKSVTIGEVSGYSLSIPGGGIEKYVLRNNTVYRFYILADEEFLNLSNQMLSTFKFIETN